MAKQQNCSTRNPLITESIENITNRISMLGVMASSYPVNLTPELVSIIFHICGDGHIGGTGLSHYAQVNEVGLRNFYAKLNNCFGDAGKLKVEWFRCFIPEAIVDFYRHAFRLEKERWYNARIPQQIRGLPKPFLVAGLAAFIVDEGHIGGDIIEIYSGNVELLGDMKYIATKLGYRCWGAQKEISLR